MEWHDEAATNDHFEQPGLEGDVPLGEIARGSVAWLPPGPDFGARRLSVTAVRTKADSLC